MTVNEVREHLLALSSMGDDLRGGDWDDIQDWHADVVAFVRDSLGEAAAEDVANRLQCRRGATDAEKQANAVGIVTDWIGTQVIGLTPEKLVAVSANADVVVVVPYLEVSDGDIGQAAGSADDSAGVEPESGWTSEVGDRVEAGSQPADGSENLE